MSDIRNDLIDTIDRVCEAHCTRELREAAENGVWPEQLWNAFDELGLVRGLLPEEAAGSGLDFDDAMAVLRRCAWHAVPVPIAETMLAGRLLMAGGLAVPEGPLTVAPPSSNALRITNAGTREARVSGISRQVPWGAECGHVVLVAQAQDSHYIALAAPSSARVQPARNLAGEPCATLTFDDSPLLAIAPLDGGIDRLLTEGALFRSVQIAGAIERVLAASLQYASERVQFGKAIGKFQAVQHMLAVLAGHAAASSAIAELAVQASAECADPFAVAAAKSRTGEAAGKSAEIAHQVHGAMGFTREHTLHYSTRRLWSWREEFGNESFWQMRLGRLVAQRGADSLWPMVTAL